MRKSFKRLFTIGLVAGSLALFSCGDNKKENKSDENQEMSNADKEVNYETETSENAEFTNDTVKQAYEEYLAVKDALVKTDASASKKAAEKLQNTLSETNPEIAEIAGRLVALENVNQQREVFSELTAAMEPVLKQAISSGKIFKQYCPMAFEGKGDYWYSNSEEIRNPYYGDMMLKCGRVDETIQ